MLKQKSSELEAINEELEKNAVRLEEQKEEINNKNVELKRKQKEVEEKANALEKTNSYKSEFLANMSHEFRTPLNSLLILTDYLKGNKKNNLTEDQIKSLNVVQSSGQDLLSLVNDVLNLSKVEAGKLDVHFIEEPVDNIIHEVEQMFIPMAKEQDLEFEVIKDNIPVSMVTDKNRLKQILKNLLQNAFKFTEKGKVTFKTSYQTNQEEVVFSVIDTGIGINSSEYESIFDSFTQIDSSLSKKYYGTGLGLTICNKLAALLGGSINVSSEVGKGSNFSLSLPIEPKIIESKALDEDFSKRKKVLIAKNNNAKFEEIVSIIKKELPEINLDVTGEREELLDCIANIKYDCTLIDYSLLDSDVRDALERKRRRMDEGSLMPFLIYTDKKLLHEEHSELAGLANGVIQRAKLAPSRLIKEIGAILSHEDKHKFVQDVESVDYNLSGRVLIVDDDVRSIYAMSKVLSDNGLTVEMASNGKKAIDKMNGNGTFDLIIMDIMMPELNGYSTIKMIREKVNYREVPIIVATAKAMKGEKEKCIAAGASDYISKPVNTKLLLEKIDYWINFDRDT